MQMLFSSLQCKGLDFKNRIVMAPLASFLTDKHGAVTDETVEHDRKRAVGGPAMIIAEACAVSKEGVWIKDAGGHERFIKAGRGVPATGIRPNTGLDDRIKERGVEVHRIGDCLEPRTAKDAILEGARLGRML